MIINKTIRLEDKCCEEKKNREGASKCWRNAILSRVVRNISLKRKRKKVEQRLKDYDRMSYTWRKAFQAEGATNIKTLKGSTHLQCVRPMLLEQSEQGGK